MLLERFNAAGWEQWDVQRLPAIPDGMPILVDDDLLFADGVSRRPATVVNRWLRDLPNNKVASAGSWWAYGRAVKAWIEHLHVHGIELFDTRVRLKDALSTYAAFHESGPIGERWQATYWNQQVSILSGFYQWAVAEAGVSAVPFTYKQATAAFGGTKTTVMTNLATRRVGKPHVTVRYLEPEFEDLFLKGLGGLGPDGAADMNFHGRELSRNGAGGALALGTGMRRREFSMLLVYELPALPRRPTEVPIEFPVPAPLAKGRKFRRTWITFEDLERVHGHVRLDRQMTGVGSTWTPPRSWGEPLYVTEPDVRGGRVNGTRVLWGALTPAERMRLVAPEGGSCLLWLKSRGAPFTAWSTVFERTSQRIAKRWDPRFPHVYPHRCRHTFAMRTLEKLARGYYASAAQLGSGDADAVWLHFLTANEPLLILRDLLGHSSVLTTEMYVKRLDVSRIYKQAYASSYEARASSLQLTKAEIEVEAEFKEEGS
ncbi:integrase [Streptomyces sp. SA15]|uniref:site-specific integrase n=1 Tax=Streptomyces sp. SA15 TaxID=934019 RepID=UPI000BAFB7BD|nr:site-specific integrase [Streptomyces sp. SA15]PAZ16025.1 integrase [Streptomyces sp. SA15]